MNAEEKVSLVMEGITVEMEPSIAELLQRPPVTLTIDDKPITIPATTLYNDPVSGRRVAKPTTIYDAARELNVNIPILCHREHMNPVAVCRFCVVDVGGRVLTAACHRQVENGMKVHTASGSSPESERVRRTVKVLTELLVSDHERPREAHHEYGDNELMTIARQCCPDGSRFPRTAPDRGQDESSTVIAVDHNACILCDRCIRGCNDVRDNQVIGRSGKGYRTKIAFDLNVPMGNSTCVSCGECMVSCPTGALTNRQYVGPIPWANEASPPQTVPAEDLYRHPLFEGVSRQFLGWNEGSVVRRRFKPGDIICRECEFGSSAFIIEEGTVEVFLQSQRRHVKTRSTGKKGLFKRMISLVSRSEDATREEESTARFIHIDAPVSLEYDHPVAELTPKDVLFGEMTCLNHYPRSATVRAKTEVVVLEVLRNVLFILLRNKKSKAILDKVYREHAIENHLRSVPIFADLQSDPTRFDAFVHFFKERVALIRLNPGEVVFRQGDPADNFYMVRTGFIKVSRRQPGGEHVLNYIGPGGSFGEIGLMSDLPELEGQVPAGVRTATCTALDHVDLVRMSGTDFHMVLETFPQVRERILRLAMERLEENERERANEGRPLGEFVRQGLMNAMSLLVLDLEKCTRCDECTKACADSHGGVTRLIREGLRFQNYLVASSCRSCLDPYCMVGCPVGSIRRKKSREIIIEDWCIGCGKCAENCPYGNINMHPFPTDKKGPDPEGSGRQVPIVQQKATMCDLCTDLDGQPSCVYACPHDAAHRYSGEQLKKLIDEK
jgi:CRP-like cAMP-binding protein/Fe-S-cluster-containing dehydrogenase component